MIFIHHFLSRCSSGEQSSHIGIELPPAGPGFDLQQMLQSVGAAQNVPPFLKSLASSLQMLQLHQPPKPPSRATSWGDTTPNVTTGGAVSSLPMELAQMMDAFKQMRPPSPNEAEAAQPTSENGEGGDERAGGQEEVTSDQSSVNENKNITKLLDERISELEKRLLGYVDSKLAELEKRLLSELGNLSQRIDTLHHAQPDSGNEQCHINNGAVLSLPLSDDQQLD